MSLALIRPREEHFDTWLAWRGQASTLRHNPLRAAPREDALRQFLDESAELSEIHCVSAFRWLVERDGVLVGNVSLKNVNRMMRTAEIAYGIDERFQGQGVGTTAVALLVDKVFAETDLRRLYALVHDENVPSLKLLDRLGFTREGVLREHYVIGGQPVNEVFFGLLRPEWMERRRG